MVSCQKSNLDPRNLANFCPVLGLPFMSKLIEKAVLKRLSTHLESSHLLLPFKSTYRSNHLTETALLCVFNDLVMTVDSGRAAVLALLDLSGFYFVTCASSLLCPSGLCSWLYDVCAFSTRRCIASSNNMDYLLTILRTILKYTLNLRYYHEFRTELYTCLIFGWRQWYTIVNVKLNVAQVSQTQSRTSTTGTNTTSRSMQ